MLFYIQGAVQIIFRFFKCSIDVYKRQMLCMLLKKCISDDYDLKKLIKIVFKYFCVFVSGIILYLLNVKVFSMIKGLELTSYQGFNKLGEIWGAGILKGVLKGYLSSFSLIYSDNCGSVSYTHLWEERNKHFGWKNRNKTFYVIRTRDAYCGIFSIYMTTLARIDEALKNGFIPVVDMQNSFNIYLNKKKIGKENAWEYYFEQPMGYTPVSYTHLEEKQNL